MNSELLQKRIIRKFEDTFATPAGFKRFMNVWPPLSASGLVITDVADDWSYGRIELRLNRLNANIHGAAFGGSLYAMTDVLFGAMMMFRLGMREWEAWTRTGSFEYIRPGTRGTYLEVEISDELVERIHRETEGGYSTVVDYTSVVRDKDGGIVGIGQQSLYVRRRSEVKPPPNPAQLEHVSGENLIAAARTLARLGMRDDIYRHQLVEHERIARRCVSPEARAVAWLQGVDQLGHVDIDDYRAAGLPSVVIEALMNPEPSDAAQELLTQVAQSRQSLEKY